MPNHIENTLVIKGDDGLIREIMGPGNMMDFGRTVPEPPESVWDWYNWNIEHWGTKWNAYDCTVIMVKRGYIEMVFRTALNPPVKWFEKTVELYPSLEFTLHWVNEEDMPYGILEGRNGYVYTQF